jgi:hypothetical protein
LDHLQLYAQYDGFLFSNSKLQGLQIQFFEITFLVAGLNYFATTIHQNVITKSGSGVFLSTIIPGMIHLFTQRSSVYAPLHGPFHGLLVYSQNKQYINITSVAIWLCNIVFFAQCSSVSSSSAYPTQNTHRQLHDAHHAHLFLQPEFVPDREQTIITLIINV